MNKKVKKIPVYAIEGDTVQERKRTVQGLLNRLGYKIDLSQITQTQGMLSIRWVSPFPDHLMEHLNTFATYGAVFFGPDDHEAKLVYIDLVFERAPGLFVDDLILRRPIILESLDRLPALLASHVEYMQKQRSEEARSHDASDPELAPKQQSLW